MPLTADEVQEKAQELFEVRKKDQERLDLIYGYLRDDPEERQLGGLPSDAPSDVVRLAKIARVNMLKYVVNSRVQGMYVDGMQTPDSPGNVAAWDVWQRNRFDARQIGVHRAATSYGASYVTVMPGEPVPVMRGASPRDLTAVYGDDDDWPEFALEKRRNSRWWLYDNEARYALTREESGSFESAGDPQIHGATFEREPVCPVVRYRDTDDLDDPVRGLVEPLIPLQDQINITSFGLLVAQHYGAFRQRYIIGWLAETEKQALKMGASRLMQFEDSAQDVQVGEFAQTDTRGYIESRKESIRQLAVVSQTSVSELVGEFINVGAEALEAMRNSHEAAVEENRTVIGESHEQALALAGEMNGKPVEPAASATWRDTSVRSLEQAVGALGELSERLGVPAQELWARVPGIPQHEVARWRERRAASVA